MKRPESKDYKNKDPQIIEIFGEDLLDYQAFAVANKEYINWLESELKILNTRVSKRRELLIGYSKLVLGENYQAFEQMEIDRINRYLADL